MAEHAELLGAGESLICDGSATVRMYDAKGKPKGSITLPALPPMVGKGSHPFTLNSEFRGDAPPRIEVRFKGANRTEEVRAHQLQRDLAPLLDQLSLKLSDEEIPLKGRLDALEGIAVVQFSKRDIVRHPLVQRIIVAYEEHRGKAMNG